MDHLANFLSRWFPGELNHDTGFHNLLSARLPKAGRILDLGCGDNYALARYRTPGLEVWGSDFEPHPELQYAEWFRRLPVHGAIPFADQTVDLVSSFMVMEHVTAPAPFFAEI